MTVVDSRGRSSTITEAIQVAQYSPIAIDSTAQGRISDESATSADTGYVKVNYTYTPISYSDATGMHHNTPRLTVMWFGNSVSVNGYASGSQVRFGDAMLNKASMYTVQIYLTDGITSATAIRKIGTAYAFMRWDPKRNRVGFGCYPQQDRCVEIGPDWTLIVDKDILIQDAAAQQLVSLQQYITDNSGGNSNIIASETEPDNPEEGMIWLDIS